MGLVDFQIENAVIAQAITAYCYNYILDCAHCETIVVAFKNNDFMAQWAYWPLKGIYQKSSTINGRESWISEFNAIWYFEEYLIIGLLKYIGTNLGGMYSNYGNTCPFYVQSEKWLYSDINVWTSAVTNEISISCLNGIYSYSRMKRYPY